MNLVEETISETDDSIMIGDTRKAISDTNVVPNLVITPNVVLIPSEVIILSKHIPGYNNVLLVANKNMNFGVNKDANLIKLTPKPTLKQKVVPVAQTPAPSQSPPKGKTP